MAGRDSVISISPSKTSAQMAGKIFIRPPRKVLLKGFCRAWFGDSTNGSTAYWKFYRAFMKQGFLIVLNWLIQWFPGSQIRLHVELQCLCRVLNLIQHYSGQYQDSTHNKWRFYILIKYCRFNNNNFFFLQWLTQKAKQRTKQNTHKSWPCYLECLWAVLHRWHQHFHGQATREAL